jgi:hypothetical protein
LTRALDEESDEEDLDDALEQELELGKKVSSKLVNR